VDTRRNFCQSHRKADQPGGEFEFIIFMTKMSLSESRSHLPFTIHRCHCWPSEVVLCLRSPMLTETVSASIVVPPVSIEALACDNSKLMTNTSTYNARPEDGLESMYG
jgi:hypothetical protein